MDCLGLEFVQVLYVVVDNYGVPTDKLYYIGFLGVGGVYNISYLSELSLSSTFGKLVL